MKIRTTWWAKATMLCVVAAMVSSCGLIPRAGPSKKEIFAGSVQREGDAFIVVVNDAVNRAASISPTLGFTEQFLRKGKVGSDTIRAGDVLGLTIWENVEDGLFKVTGAKSAALQEIQVDGAGFIFVPYAGRIKASGNSPDAIRRIITRKLEDQTPEPQVEVRRLAGDGATVTVVGSVGGQGNYPIERPTRTLTAMLAAAGGVNIPTEVARIIMTRGNAKNEIWLTDLYDYPANDIALRSGDRILVEEDTRAYTALGATGSQNRVDFQSKTLSAIEAIAQVGGLQTNASDPTGVFVLRNEPELIAQRVTGRTDVTGTQRLAYVLDLTRPNGLFIARDFVIRDGDTIYVTEAPIVAWDKTLSALTGSLGAAQSISSAVGN